MKKTILGTAAVVAMAGAATSAYVKSTRHSGPPAVSTMKITKGDVSETVTSTGTLRPLKTGQVGTQVSGIVKNLYVDYNSIVHKGELIAELDPELLQAQVDASIAAVAQANVALTSADDTLQNDQLIQRRAKQLLDDGLDTSQDYETAALQVKQDQAAVDDANAALATAEANVEEANINLQHATITAPIDGVVIERDVDVGQSVAARASAPTLYVVGTDLTNMQVIADVDESEISRIRPDQVVLFHVDSYPSTTFHGTVSSIRLDAVTTNNVVTFPVVITADNRRLQLRPSMTANVTIETGHAAGVLRVPNQALRFRPTNDMFTAFGQPIPPPTSLAAENECAGGPCREAEDSTSSPPAPASHAALTIDEQFAPRDHAATPGQVWVIEHNQLKRVPVQLGMADATWTELVAGDLPEGSDVITAVDLPGATSAPAARNPLLQNRGGGPGGFGRGR